MTPQLDENVRKLDTREWRVSVTARISVTVVAVDADGTHRDTIAVIPGDHDQALARADQIVAEHAMLSAPWADEQHQGGHWLDVLPQRPRWAKDDDEASGDEHRP